VLAENGDCIAHVFDEIDAGTSGAVAEAIGRSLADIARHKQVIAITHLPQIAALADAHFVIDKSDRHGRTISTVRRLLKDERVREVARMIGGAKVGKAAHLAARELLATA
jgi:DNA repair protein RecN (Recombination protein N)